MYESFIEDEREYSRRFLKMNQICEDRFDEYEYSVIKALFNNESMISKIFVIINDLIKKEGFKYPSKYIIFGDFVFSMSSFSLEDPSNLIFKTSRSDYFKRINERAEINKDFGYQPNDYVILHKKLMIGLRAVKVIERTILRKKDDNWETIIYFKLVMPGRIDLPLGFSKFPFIISLNKEYSIGSFRNIWLLKRKRREMEDFPICTKSVVRGNGLMFHLDKVLYSMNLKIIEGEKMRILREVNCNNIDDYLNKLHSIVEDISYGRSLIRSDMSKEDRIDLFKLNIEMKKDFRDILKIFQEIIPFMVLDKEIIGKKYYLPCFIDNRGRQYYATLLSPTFYKIFRYLCGFVEKKEIVKLEESKFYNIIMKYRYTVEKFNLDYKNSYLLMILFMEIGKHFIETEDNCFVKTDEIIKLGILNYNKEKILKFDEMLYVNKIENEIDKLLNGDEVDINTLIFKDATASGLQNYGVLMGYNEEKLKYLNIDGEDWCDTYQYLINKFVGENKKYRKRKYWKSTIMTIPYNAVWFSCFTKFLRKLREDGIEYRDFDEEEREKIKIMHKKFYNEIKNNVKKEFFGNNDVNFIKFRYNEWKILSKRDYKINYKKLRDKYRDVIYDIVEDREATLRANEANNLHYLDAKLIKAIIESFDILPIHDCFGIRLSELHLVMDEINKYYSKIIGKKTYGLHIIK